MEIFIVSGRIHIYFTALSVT